MRRFPRVVDSDSITISLRSARRFVWFPQLYGAVSQELGESVVSEYYEYDQQALQKSHANLFPLREMFF